MLTITLTPNRRNTAQYYARYVRYDRTSPTIIRPVLVEVDVEGQRASWLEWDKIQAGGAVDPEQQAAWSGHVRAEQAKADLKRAEADAAREARGERPFKRPIGER